MCVFMRLRVLTRSAQEEEDGDPVDPEQHEPHKGPERLQHQQGKVDEDFARHVEQRDGERHPLPHDEHHDQEDHLRGSDGRRLASR